MMGSRLGDETIPIGPGSPGPPCGQGNGFQIEGCCVTHQIQKHKGHSNQKVFLRIADGMFATAFDAFVVTKNFGKIIYPPGKTNMKFDHVQ